MPVAPASSGARILLTIRVADVDALCAILHGRGVTLLNGPVDRPWGRRTAAFAAPALAQNPPQGTSQGTALATPAAGQVESALLSKITFNLTNPGGKSLAMGGAFTAIADRVIHIKEGRVEAMELNDNPVPAETVEW